MRYKVDPAFESMSAVEFTRDFLSLWDTTQLSEFKFRVGKVSGCKGIHGNCKPPRYPNLSHTTFRISCSVSGTDEDFPKRGTSFHAGTLRPEYVAQNVNELLAWVAGHEIFHYLAQPSQYCLGLPDATGQIAGRVSSERGADLLGYEFLYAVREGRSPVEVAIALVEQDETMLVAPHRYPYRREA